jgi:hypothetical protein
MDSSKPVTARYDVDSNNTLFMVTGQPEPDPQKKKRKKKHKKYAFLSGK